MTKNQTITVKGTEITIFQNNSEDYISLSGIARFRDAERSDYILQNWMRNRSTIEFIGLWEQLNNPNFKSIEFDHFGKKLTMAVSTQLKIRVWQKIKR